MEMTNAMVQTTKRLNRMREKLHSGMRKDYGILFVLLMILCLGGCAPKHSSYSEFKEICENGWVKTEACEFVPQCADSLTKCDVDVALCFSQGYEHRNMSVVVDFVKGDSLVKRKVVDCVLTDANGNWLVSGFGVMYQVRLGVLTGVKPKDFDKLQVWQGLDCDTLKNVERVGVFVEKTQQ
jgi:gliding motility-associated lipoprotein GldH